MDSRILIVDDDEAICESLLEYMQMFGYNALTAATAEEALDILKKENIEVVITDIMLPGMDGLELTDLIKKNYDPDVIVMTGFSGDYSYEEAITRGASDFVFKPVRFEELLLRLKRVLNERQLSRERVQMLKKLQQLAITDNLTKLYNSRHFFQQIKKETERARRYNLPLALMLLDIDFFKNYNDTHGHLEGDKVLARMGEIIMSELRKIDSAYRYGGEEFTIILPETGADDAEIVGARIRSNVEKEIFRPGEDAAVGVTISMGVTEFHPREDVTAFVQRADRAMYLSKKNGRNRITLLYPENAGSKASARPKAALKSAGAGEG